MVVEVGRVREPARSLTRDPAHDWPGRTRPPIENGRLLGAARASSSLCVRAIERSRVALRLPQGCARFERASRTGTDQGQSAKK